MNIPEDSNNKTIIVKTTSIFVLFSFLLKKHSLSLKKMDTIPDKTNNIKPIKFIFN